jgi:glycosyltransferase involved in cell wall biosynthesis
VPTQQSIHQFTPSVAWGDGVTQGVFYCQKLLKELGFHSIIYARHIDPKLQDKVLSIDTYTPSKDQWLLYHYSILDEDADKIMQFTDHKIMIYHNITPAHFFLEGTFLRHVCHEAREQLKRLHPFFEASLADSAYNAGELALNGYSSIEVLPLLSDAHVSFVFPHQDILQKYQSFYTILYVGRIALNKSQHHLIETLYALKQLTTDKIHLVLVGGTSDQEYLNFLYDRIVLLDLQDEVSILGKVDDASLESYYHVADMYVSLSEHEGFGIPLIEAMRHNIPVLAYASTAVKEHISTEGMLMVKNPFDIAKKILNTMYTPSIRTKIIEEQKMLQEQFSNDTIRLKLFHWLKKQGLKPNAIDQETLKKEPSSLHVCIEGPFDSTYSLAKVNRDLTHCLVENGLHVTLHSTEGHGDFLPNEHFLKHYPEIQNRYKAYHPSKCPDVIIRNLYPPRTNAMHASSNIMGPYGWEESVFPCENIIHFNQRLNQLWCMSDYVRKTMIDNGLMIQATTTGIIADEITAYPPEPIELEKELPKGWRILHISSAFPRKGIDVLIEAFVLFLHKNSDAVLIIKTFPNPHNMVEKELLTHCFEKVTILSSMTTLWTQKEGGTIVWINGDIPISQMRWLYENSDVFVAPSCGEGFGLPMAEAMFLKLPVITTAYGGQRDFCTEKTAWLIDYYFEYAKTHMQLFDSVWSKPLSSSLVQQLENVKNSTKETLNKKVEYAYSFVQDHYTQKAFAKRIIPLLKAKNKIVSKEEKIGWISTWNTRCGIATYSKHVLDHFQTPVMILASYSDALEQTDNKNVIRCWNDKGESDFQKIDEAIAEHSLTILIIQFNYNFFDFNALSKWILKWQQQGLCICINLHSTVDQDREDKKIILLKEALSKCYRVFVHSMNDLNRLKVLDLIDNITLFPLGVMKSNHKQKVYMSSSEILLASYGFFLPNKGLLELIQVVKILRDKGLNVIAHLVNAKYPMELSESTITQAKELISQLQIDQHITLTTEFLSDEISLAYLSKADLILFPYQNTGESASGAVRYGIASGVPVAVTPLAIFDDLNKSVFQLSGSSPEHIAQSIEQILEVLLQNHPEAIQVRQKAINWRETHEYHLLAKRLETICTRHT